MNRTDYIKFLKAKIDLPEDSGIANIDVPLIQFKDGTSLKPHQRDAINWALRGGKRALFESFGLGKTIQQLIICNQITQFHGSESKALIVCPLGVRQEFKKDAERKLGISITYVRNMAEVISSVDQILITNYERVRDGDIDPNYFIVTSLDEASVLRSYGSKTYQTFLQKFKGVKYKYVCTATPSPNKFKELIHYAGYLEIMDTGQALTRFFKRDSTKANNLTLYEHKEQEFWLWMSTWALFITKPSDLGYDDTGYDLPDLKVIYHMVNVDHSSAGVDRDGQVKMYREAALGLKDAAKEKRDSLTNRIEKIREIITSYNDKRQYVIWCDLNNEQKAIEQMLKEIGVTFVSLYGSDDADKRESEIERWKNNEVQVFLTKPDMYGSGVNLQQCSTMIFAGINYEFNSFIQAIHRIYRFLQQYVCEINIVFAESESEILKTLEEKWKNHNYLVEQMVNIIKENGLSSTNVEQKLLRTLGINRKEEKGKLFTSILNDCVLESYDMPDNSVDLIHTSIPFSNHYEYTPSYNDFGHNTGNLKFFEQMDFLTPQLLRILVPGRLAVIHVKDRILFGNATGTGMPTVDPFSDMTVFHFIKHGFQYMGRITIETDVVRENNQTYRLGWTEQCKDGSKMGIGCPEYLLLFRKLPSDTSKAYSDIPVTKTKQEYTRGRWQIDARAKWNSSGDRFLSPSEIRALPVDKLGKYFAEFMEHHVYDFKQHVDIANEMDSTGKLPATFESLKINARSEWVWSDINRMITLNSSQTQKKLQNHVCPLQFDIVDRVIERYSNPGELVFDPFGGISTVPYRAVKLGRIGKSTELNQEYWKDGLSYLRAMEHNVLSPTLFEIEKIA